MPALADTIDAFVASSQRARATSRSAEPVVDPQRIDRPAGLAFSGANIHRNI